MRNTLILLIVLIGLVYQVNAQMYIKDDGYVGVGTVNPSSRLTVNGVIETISGGIKFPDSTFQTTAQIQGPEGPPGVQGIQGEVGIEGPPGVQGIQGETGIEGAAGVQGIQGEVGPSFGLKKVLRGVVAFPTSTEVTVELSEIINPVKSVVNLGDAIATVLSGCLVNGTGLKVQVKSLSSDSLVLRAVALVGGLYECMFEVDYQILEYY